MEGTHLELRKWFVGDMAHVRPEGKDQRLRPAKADRLQLKDGRAGPFKDILAWVRSQCVQCPCS